MPYSILIEHTVRVVHPSVEGGVVVCRTIFLLPVGGIERVGKVYSIPAYCVGSLSDGAASVRRNYVKNHVVTFISGEVEGNAVVGFRICETHEDGLCNLTIHKHVDSCIVNAFLHRKHDKILISVDSYKSVVHSKMVYPHPVLSGKCAGSEKYRSA